MEITPHIEIGREVEEQPLGPSKSSFSKVYKGSSAEELSSGILEKLCIEHGGTGAREEQ